jgi:tetratricopeptide (TPR) repeat protein
MKCFAIMPYGLDDQGKKEFSLVYRLLIKEAADQCGLTCIRSDLNPQGGYIMTNVLNDLANSDIVVADLTDLNWNVAYELGIRHALRKKGTILICNERHKSKLPFDIQSHAVIFYPEQWLTEMDDIIDKIKNAINNCQNGICQKDSPVHDVFPALPAIVVEQQENAQTEALKQAEAQVATLTEELQSLKERMEAMGLSADEKKEETIDFGSMFKEELEKSIYNSDEAVAKLREFLQEDKKEEFLEFLGKVLEIGFLDETDCKVIYRLCRELKVPSITRMFLESVIKFYPESDDLIGYLANEYSKNYHTGDKALQMVNGIVGVIKKDGQYQLSKSVRLTDGKLAAFFDVYLHLKKYTDILEVGNLICERYKNNPKVCGITLRNMSNAALRLDMFSEARSYLDALLQMDPSNDIVHWLCSQYENALDNYPGAIMEIEHCIRLDRNDTDYYFAMAAYICDDLFARDHDTLEIRKIDSSEAIEYAVPFLLAALSTDPSPNEATRVIDFLRRNHFNAYIDPLVDAYRRGNLNFSEVFSELNFRGVNYCFGLSV